MTKESMPPRRKSWTQKVRIGGQTFYLTCGEYADGRLGEVFLSCSKAGSFSQGVCDTLARLVSVALQDGVPLARVIHAMQMLNFPPNGEVTGSKVATNATSVPDWLAQELAAAYCSGSVVNPVVISENLITSGGAGAF